MSDAPKPAGKPAAEEPASKPDGAGTPAAESAGGTEKPTATRPAEDGAKSPAADPGGSAPEKPTPKPAAAKPAAKPGAAGAKKPPAKAAKPPRPLPSHEEIAGWIEGKDLPVLAALFDQLVLPKFDGLTMQIKKEELLPQHWRVIRQRSVDEASFDQLPEVARLRLRYQDDELADRRLAALKVAWTEIGGKQPSLWTVSDLFAALRRIIAGKLEVDFHELLSVARDVWAGLRLPHGKQQLEVLWACLAFVRTKTKK